MTKEYFVSNRDKFAPWLLIIMVLAITAWQLRQQGRLWFCACGRLYLWAGDIWRSHCSQHFFDPYSFTHLLHGLIFFGLLVWILPRLSPAWRLSLAICGEALWEVCENSAFVIQRYREATVSLGYTGDTVINSMVDILACGIGFAVARYLGFRRSLMVFVVTEVILLIWIRDNLTLNILMLIYPVNAIKAWQMIH